MAWLLGPMIASFVASFIVARIVEVVLGGMTGLFVTILKPAVFVTTWTVVSAQSMMRNFTRAAHRVRQGNAAIMKSLTHSK